MKRSPEVRECIGCKQRTWAEDVICTYCYVRVTQRSGDGTVTKDGHLTQKQQVYLDQCLEAGVSP